MRGGSPAAEGVHAGPAAAPLLLYSTVVRPEWVDYNEHMSEWCYLLVMGNSADRFFRHVGIDEAYRAGGGSLFTVETHLRNVREVALGDDLSLSLQVLGADRKRVHLAHVIGREDGEEVATGEQMLVHVDTRRGRVRPLPDDVHRRIQHLAAVHRTLPAPAWVGQVMGLPGDAGPPREAVAR